MQSPGPGLQAQKGHLPLGRFRVPYDTVELATEPSWVHMMENLLKFLRGAVTPDLVFAAMAGLGAWLIVLFLRAAIG